MRLENLLRLNRTTSRGVMLSACCGVACVAAPPAGATDFEPPQGEEPRSDEGVLELVPGVDISAILSRYPGFTLLDSIPSRDIYLVSYLQQLNEDQFELLFLNDIDIDHSELNFDTGNSGPSSGSLFFNVAPVEFVEQPVWGQLGLPAAHGTSTGMGTTIAFIDTGIDLSNPMFFNKIHPASTSYIGAPGDLQDAGNGLNDDGEGLVDEMVGHGTWVAGIASMVAPDAMLMPIRAVNDEGFSNAFSVSKAIYHAIDNGANVINLSIGSVAQVRVVERAVDDASDLGIIVVAAAGNQGIGIPEFPAGNHKAVGVAAVELGGIATPFTNYAAENGPELLLCAPGEGIIGPVPGGFGRASGTSAAVPFVAGTAALLIEKGTVRRFDDFEDMAKDTAFDVRALNPGLPSEALGEGMLQIDAALTWVGPCFADLADDGAAEGVLDLADLQLFIQLFTIRDEAVDYVAPRGVWDLGDLQFFLTAFNDGCP
jgi:hypothetical protein